MEHSELFNDEVIADSEDENDMDMGTFGASEDVLAGLGGANLNLPSSVSAFTLTGHHQKANALSSISTFTAGPSAVPEYRSGSASMERVRMEKGKQKEADTSINSVTGAYTDFESFPGSIADRAKTRQRPQKSAPSTSDVIELTSDDDDELSLKPSISKVKPKPKPKVKPKAKEKEDAIETPGTSNQPDPIPAAAPRPRPRPRPIVKRPKTIPDDAVSHAPYPPTSTPPSNGPEIPIASSPPRLPNHHTMTSQLPPSDPPIPTLSTVYNGQNDGLPRIETLPNPGMGIDFGGPLSSPSSLFSERGTKTKRKRNVLDVDAEIDELATSQGAPDNMRFPHRLHSLSPRRMPPPPTFFAGSSSSSFGGGRDNAAAPAFNSDPEPQHEVVDLTTLPCTNDVRGPVPKPKKPRKKKADEHDEGAAPKMIVLDEDDGDDDFDPGQEGVKKKKGKAKSKEKTATAKGKAKANESLDGPGKGQVEVVITSKPQTKGKGKDKATGKAAAKDKRKQVEIPGKDANKEIFKSREFIEDSDEEPDPLQLVGSGGGTSAESAHTPTTSSSAKITGGSRPTPAAAPHLATSLLSKSSYHPPDPPHFTDLDSDMRNLGSSSGKPGRGGSKKRKNIVDSEAEDDEVEVDDVVRVNPPSPISTAKKRKAEGIPTKDKGKKKKGKNVVLSDKEDPSEAEAEREEVGMQKQKQKPPKPRKASKKVIDDDEDTNEPKEVQPVAHDQRSTPEQIPESVKENIIPVTAKPTASTPRLTTVPRAMGTNDGENKTPLYARYEIAPRKSSLPMSELIRRANSLPGSPFSTPHPSTPSAHGAGASKLKPLIGRTSTAYSPYLKSSRSMLSRIAPLHPNRRTPPPPPPPPPPRKKSKKELEMEEKWEEEMVESVGGMEAWAVLGDDERREIRKAKWARELGGWDE